MPPLRLHLLPGEFSVCRLHPDAAAPTWACGPLVSITRTGQETSVVCHSDHVPAGIERETGLRCARVAGRLAFTQTGILRSLTGPLADAGIPVFALSTFDTDYLLVRSEDCERARRAWTGAGITVG